ncbi:MAG: CDP-alcohol phosphatidyltransferase family protein [Planctomycetota bacterium]|nr:CDP-alcohol phosphatidyltransferase family protein [Planctomycetota bacterium]MCX8040247.1 CDP-alcohol phosphatidyltransferase family protein [Planctomycetota bacterium]MDW8372458.1 CDP-alcohol phosphatidyltransferase family protein [Planctomycetota bacterium]
MSERLRLRLRRLKTLPVLPTLLTAGNLAAGITAILCAVSYVPGSAEHQWRLFWGAVCIFAAMVCDMFDGKVARMTRTAGPFGAELDSLADVVSFGLAPAILVHRLVMGQPGIFAYGEKLLWFVTVFYAVMAAIRLARYNVEHAHGGGEATTHFRGLPSPGAAALICGWVMFHQWAIIHPDLPLSRWLYAQGLIVPQPWIGLESMDPFRWALVGITILAGLLMVSTISYPHVGSTLFGRLGFRTMMALLTIIAALLIIDLPYVIAAATTGYLLWGLALGAVEAWRNWRRGLSPLADAEEAAAEDAGAASDEGPIDPGPAHGR